MAKNLTYNYFVAAEKDFWRWSEDGEVIEWNDGRTLCYRTELIGILKALAPEGWMDLNSVLLLLVACRESWLNTKENTKALETIFTAMNGPNSVTSIVLWDPALHTYKALQLISDLPQELRSDRGKIHLIQTLYRNKSRRYGKRASEEMLSLFESGSLDALLFRNEELERGEGRFLFFRPGVNTGLAHVTLKEIQDLLLPYSTADQLAFELRTGLSEEPEPLDLEPPHEEGPGLMDELEADPRTRLIARLTRQLTAALHIPMRLDRSSDQLFGGVSDITNRGNYDRLLLSELANDDHVLMARLANNEALFLRREEMPDNQEKQRLILLDTTLKMWGKPRVMAIAAALALSRQEGKGATTVMALGGKESRELKLETKEEVLEALTFLDPGLSCLETLQDLVQRTFSKIRPDADELFFMSEETTFDSPTWQRELKDMKKPPDYTVALGRLGQVRLFGHRDRRKKQLSEAYMDIEALMRLPGKTSEVRKMPDSSERYTPDAHPLYYPVARVVLKYHNTFIRQGLGVFTITKDQRLLYWASASKGAQELASHLEPGTYCFGYDNVRHLVIGVFQKARTDIPTGEYIEMATGAMVRNESTMLLYTFDLVNGNVGLNKLSGMNMMNFLFFDGSLFYTYIGHRASTVDPFTTEVKTINYMELHEAQQKSVHSPRPSTQDKRFINNGYSPILNLRKVYLNKRGELQFDRYALRLQDGKLFFSNLNVSPPDVWPTKEDRVPIQEKDGRNIYHQRFQWKNGSSVILDHRRGLLYLKSADPKVPEITLVFVVSQPTSVWSADEKVSGSAYFIKEGHGTVLPVNEFYKRYIQEYINAL